MSSTTNRIPRVRLLTITTVASNLSLSEKTIRRLIDRGKLRVNRVGRTVRIDADELEVFLARTKGKDHP